MNSTQLQRLIERLELELQYHRTLSYRLEDWLEYGPSGTVESLKEEVSKEVYGEDEDAYPRT